MSDWRQRQKQALRSELYETAIRLFEADGYENTTVRRITEEVGVAKGTFFNHFPTKEHVVGAWYDGVTREALAKARERSGQSAEQSIHDLIVEMAQWAVDSPELLRAKSRHSSHPLLVEAERRQDDEMDAFVLEQCESGKRRGELAADLDSEKFVGLIGAMLTGTSRNWVSTGGQFDFPAVVSERVEFLFRAARAVGS